MSVVTTPSIKYEYGGKPVVVSTDITTEPDESPYQEALTTLTLLKFNIFKFHSTLRESIASHPL